ncbi:MAG: DNA mismatch repair endonuclease MutL [Candidatus Sericytochromatia bacterium]|nr:DNA mismatch repair endonuclease MutL [Candidatus Sericytochromatia bacterium]
MAEIRILDPQVANQIAAGEVVERPASVIKELVENALDAGATVIQVEADAGGRELCVIDNGQGIPAEAVPLAFQRFATSKLSDYADIWSLNTMGFRGEALPSIASVSKVEILSRTAEQPLARRLLMHGGEIMESSDAGGPVGTRLQIADLFYNTPARLKFMSRENTELGYIQQLMQAFALGFPQVRFKWLKKGKVALQTSGQGDLMDVVDQLFGRELSASLFAIEHQLRGAEISGLLSYPDYVRRDRNHQYFFVNQRWVKVPALTKLLDEVYADLIPRRSYPAAILQLQLPPDSVDINVHPTKREVKFKNFSLIYQLLREAVGKALERYDTRRDNPWDAATPVASDTSEFVPAPLPAPALAADDRPPWLQSAATNTGGSTASASLHPLPGPDPDTSAGLAALPARQLQGVRQPAAAPYQSASQPAAAVSQPALPGLELASQDRHALREQESLQSILPVGQVCENTYIVAQFGRDIVFIDQHVAEERYLYEKMLAEGEILRQGLTVAVIVELSPVELALLETHAESFAQAGFELEAYGPSAMAIRSLPYCLRLSQAEETFRSLLQDLLDFDAGDPRTAAYRLFCKTVACHSAVRAGDPLHLDQMREIVANWARTRNPYTCPHGRPILVKMPKEEINKRFLRSWS